MAATAAGNALSKQEQDRMCRAKRRYRREGDALDSAVRARMRGAFAARVYRCPVCSHWHVGGGPARG